MEGCGAQPCPGAVPGRVCAAGPGGGFVFFFPASFLFPLLYVTAQIFGLSAPVGDRLGCLEGLGPSSAPSGWCTERVGRGEGMLRLAMLATLVSTGQDGPGRCQMRQRGPPASLLGSFQGCIHLPRALLWWEAGSTPASFPTDFLPSQTSLHPPWPPLLRPALGRVLQEVALIPKQLKGLAQEGLYRPCTGAYLLCAFISGDVPTLAAWSPGLLSSTDIWGNDAQGCLFWVTEELFHVRDGLSGGAGSHWSHFADHWTCSHWHFDPMAPGDTLAALVQGCCQGFSGCVL